MIMLGASASALGWPLLGDAASAASVQTADADRGGRFEISLPVDLGGRELGQIDAELDAADQIAVDRRQLAELLGPRLPAEIRMRLVSPANGQSRATIAELAELGVPAQFDATALRISIDIPIDRQGAVALRAIDDSASAVGGDYLEARPFSASLTLFGSQNLEWQGEGATARPIGLLGQFASNMGGLSGVSLFGEFARDGEAGGRIRRGNVVLVHDDVDRAVRFSLGDTPVAVAGFQAAPVIGGLSVARSYSELQPFRNIRPGGQFRFQIDRPTLVDIRVNGASIRQMRLDPGQYDVGDFPFLTGQNEVEIYAFDDFNQRLITRFSQFFSANLLRPGLSEFAFSIGVPQQRDRSGGISYSNDEPLATGFFRRGLSEALTLGLNAQANRFGWLTGLEGSWASPIGSFLANLAISSNRESGRGTQALLAYDLNVLDLGAVRNLRANAEVRLISSDFRLVGPRNLGRLENTYKREVRGALSALLPGGVFVGLNGAYLQRRDSGGAEYRVGATASAVLGRFNMTAALETARIAGLGRDTRFVITLLRTLGERSTMRATFDSQQNSAQLQYTRFEAPEVGEYGLDVQLERNDRRWTGSGGARFNANRFQAAVRHDVIRTTRGEPTTTQRSTYSIASQIAFDGNRLALGRPVGPSFAIVSGHPSLEKRAIRVGQGFGRRKPQAQSGLLGPALAPVGALYSPQIINIDVEDLPIGYDPGKVRYDVFPGAATGYGISVGSSASRIVIGRLVDDAGSPVALQVGKLSTIELGRETSEALTFFTDRSGRFTIEGVRPGRYRAAFGTSTPLVIEIEVSPDGIGLLDLGAVTATRGETR
ncbi:hypothetical protein GVO57_06265 [Sphingomonas changnyeongensis]|uniref:Fimbrial biogenesis outer membrane usher protein n=1 Tax=Sphingomonas changnyeongensis TaxID=2698679 RepID=A0A7Z2NVJ7_9SPHN|nr:hypothetical protein [Sphingomonas changnyeongensis]QHL90517.1 hypothetical protein GVO57_06265 [Sphingomonas changnyeongensis]